VDWCDAYILAEKIVSSREHATCGSRQAILRVPRAKLHRAQLFVPVDLINLSDDLFVSLVGAASSHHEHAIKRHVNLKEEVREFSLVFKEDQPSRISHRDPRWNLLHIDK